MIEVKVDTAALSKLIDDLGEGFDDEVVEAMDTSVRFPTIPCASQVVLHMGDTRSRTIPPLRPCPSPCLRYWWPLMGHRSPSMDRWGRVKQPLRAMQPRAVADAIRSRAAAAGIDRASGHSLRVGAAVSMAQRGASLVAMQQAGGWRSPDMPAHYARPARWFSMSRHKSPRKSSVARSPASTLPDPSPSRSARPCRWPASGCWFGH